MHTTLHDAVVCKKKLTLPKTNIAPENSHSQKDYSLPTTIFQELLLMEEILHHLGYKNPANNGMNYQPQLVSRISSINS